MSSLLQFNGETGRDGVRLQFCRTKLPIARADWPQVTGASIDLYWCAQCGREHSRVGLAWRRPAGMWGCWVLFRYLGGTHAPDLSCPVSVPEWPKGTKILSDAESSAIWHSA